MKKRNSILVLCLSLFFVACGGGSNSSNSQDTKAEVEKKVLNDNTNAAFNLPNVKNSENLPTHNLQTSK